MLLLWNLNNPYSWLIPGNNVNRFIIKINDTCLKKYWLPTEEKSL